MRGFPCWRSGPGSAGLEEGCGVSGASGISGIGRPPMLASFANFFHLAACLHSQVRAFSAADTQTHTHIHPHTQTSNGKMFCLWEKFDVDILNAIAENTIDDLPFTLEEVKNAILNEANEADEFGNNDGKVSLVEVINQLKGNIVEVHLLWSLPLPPSLRWWFGILTASELRTVCGIPKLLAYRKKLFDGPVGSSVHVF